MAGRVELPKQEALPREETSVEADLESLKELPESKDVFLDEEEKPPVVLSNVTSLSAPAPAPVPKDEVTVEVEKVLEEGLGTFFATLPESAKPKFKQKGEEAATELSGMVRSLKIQVKRALVLIRDWLLTIPGVNKFFLEQEAKIKVDRLIEIAEARKEDLAKRP